jgi:DNA-directed RNA polymerase beta subunit
MSRLLSNNFRHRHTFTKSPPAMEVSNLIEIQCRSYEVFLQANVPLEDCFE